MKAVLVMDMPDNGCMDCTVCKKSFLKTICGITGNGVSGNHERGGFPEECPLKPMPEKMQVCGKYPQPDRIVPSYKIGWNACIDEIMGGNNND